MFFIFILLSQQHSVVISQLLIAEDIKHPILTIIVRLAYSGIEPGIGKAVYYAVISVGIRQISEESLYLSRLYHDGSGAESYSQYKKNSYEISLPLYTFFLLRPFYKEQNQESYGYRHAYGCHDYLEGRHIIADYSYTVVQYAQIFDREWSHSLG